MRSRTTVCLRSASPALSQLSPWWLCRHLARACAVNSFGDSKKRFSFRCQPLGSKRSFVVYLEFSDGRHTVRRASSRTWLLLLRTCSTTQSCPSEPGGDTVALPALPAPLPDAPDILSEQVSPSRTHHLRACHTLRSTILVPCASARGDAPGPAPHVSIARPFSSHPCGGVSTSGTRSPPFARRMKLPMWPMMALLVSTAALYVSYRMDWKKSSRAPSLASSSARSLPAVV